MYETDAAESQYCEAHYGQKYFNVEIFPIACVKICLEYMRDRPTKRALDLGCAVGRSAFELAKIFDLVTGVDFSARFIRIARRMQEKGAIRYSLVEEGDIVSYHEKRLKDLGLDPVKDKVKFVQADAINLKPQFSHYDLILAANLIDRLYDPKRFLTTIHERLNQGGVLVLASPYTWLETFTKRDKWVGGFTKEGKSYTTLEGLGDLLGAHFRMIGEPREIEFVIRETRRKFQNSLSQLTAWERIG